MTEKQEEILQWFQLQLEKAEERYAVLMDSYMKLGEKLFEQKEKNESR